MNYGVSFLLQLYASFKSPIVFRVKKTLKIVFEKKQTIIEKD